MADPDRGSESGEGRERPARPAERPRPVPIPAQAAAPAPVRPAAPRPTEPPVAAAGPSAPRGGAEPRRLPPGRPSAPPQRPADPTPAASGAGSPSTAPARDSRAAPRPDTAAASVPVPRPSDRPGDAEPATAAAPPARPQSVPPRARTKAGPQRKPATTRPVGSSAAVVPPQSVAGNALILVVAIMGFLACVAFGVLTLVNEAARAWQLDVSREVTIQVKPVDGVPTEANLQRALTVARETPGVRAVRLMSDADGARLLEPWLGAGLDLSGLPIPRLVVIDLADPAGVDLAGLRQRLADEVKGAILDDHSIWASRLRTMAGTMVVAGLVVLTLVIVAMVLSVVFATRAAMAGNRDVIEVLHFVGAEDAFIAREFQRHFLLMGFKGGAVGGLVAMVAFVIADWVTRGAPGNAATDQAQALFGGFSVGWVGYLGAAGIVGLVAVLTAITSRWTVRSYLNQLE